MKKGFLISCFFVASVPAFFTAMAIQLVRVQGCEQAFFSEVRSLREYEKCYSLKNGPLDFLIPWLICMIPTYYGMKTLFMLNIINQNSAIKTLVKDKWDEY